MIILAEADHGAIVWPPLLLLHLDDEVAQIVETDLASEGGIAGAVVVRFEGGNDETLEIGSDQQASPLAVDCGNLLVERICGEGACRR